MEILNPRPVPDPTGLVVKKGSNTRVRFSGSIPQPWSEISMQYSEFSILVEIRTVFPGLLA
jgi:hypothetical protein